MQQHAVTHGSRGFTLMELMIVVVIATILVSIAVPSYLSQVRQSRRTQAKTAVLDLAGREERYFSTNGALYSTTPADLGYAGAFPALVAPDNYYRITVCTAAAAAATPACDPNPNAPPGPSYYITATPVGGSSQAADTQCQSFSVDSTGQQFSTGTLTSQECWAQ
ncbi:MAG TPA: type IV pilin protein [Steroidobacteraceae bacterium]